VVDVKQGRERGRTHFFRVCAMQQMAMQAATLPSAFFSPSTCCSSRSSFGALPLQVGQLTLPNKAGSQRSLPKRKNAWRCAAATEGKQVGGKSQMLVSLFLLLCLISNFRV
jgi:hypothetical protein